MIEQNTVKSMKQTITQHNTQWRPSLVLRTADAYADRINSKKNNSTKGLNTDI